MTMRQDVRQRQALSPMVQRVQVTAVDAARMLCTVRNSVGKDFVIDYGIERTPFTPAPGESWLIDRGLGMWTLAARLGGSPGGGSGAMNPSGLFTAYVGSVDSGENFGIVTWLDPTVTGDSFCEFDATNRIITFTKTVLAEIVLEAFIYTEPNFDGQVRASVNGDLPGWWQESNDQVNLWGSPSGPYAFNGWNQRKAQSITLTAPLQKYLAGQSFNVSFWPPPGNPLPYTADASSISVSAPPIPLETGAGGAPGESAYQIAVDNGFVGTETEWLDSLRGDPGPSGTPAPIAVYGSDEFGNEVTSDTLTMLSIGYPLVTGVDPGGGVHITGKSITPIMLWAGVWDSDANKSYAFGQVVSRSGRLFVCRGSGGNVDPDSPGQTFWELIPVGSSSPSMMHGIAYAPLASINGDNLAVYSGIDPTFDQSLGIRFQTGGWALADSKTLGIPTEGLYSISAWVNGDSSPVNQRCGVQFAPTDGSMIAVPGSSTGQPLPSWTVAVGPGSDDAIFSQEIPLHAGALMQWWVFPETTAPTAGAIPIHFTIRRVSDLPVWA